MSTSAAQVTAPGATYRAGFTARPEDIPFQRRTANEFLRTRGASREVRHAVSVCISELLSNVCKHAADPPLCALLVQVTAQGVLLAVSDTSDELPTRIEAPQPLAESGRGLFLLDAYATQWGCTRLTAGGKQVWAIVSGDGEADDEE